MRPPADHGNASLPFKALRSTQFSSFEIKRSFGHVLDPSLMRAIIPKGVHQTICEPYPKECAKRAEWMPTAHFDWHNVCSLRPADIMGRGVDFKGVNTVRRLLWARDAALRSSLLCLNPPLLMWR